MGGTTHLPAAENWAADRVSRDNKYERRWLFPAAVADLSRNRCVATVRSTLMDNQWKIDRRVLEMWTFTTEAAIPHGSRLDGRDRAPTW